MTVANEELLDFFEHGARIFGPSTRGRIQIGDHIARFNFPADATWSAPPPKRFIDTRNLARSSKRRTRNG
jgi:hypothetical protein